MEEKLSVKRKGDTKSLGVFLAIVLTILHQIALTKIPVRIVDQLSTHTVGSVSYQASALTVVESTRVLQKCALDIQKSFISSERIIWCNKMKLFSINCQSWKTAKSNFYSIVDDYNIDVLCLTETFESEREPVCFRKWCKLNKPRKDGYGGVAILYKDSENGAIFERRPELERDDVEAICTEIKINKCNSFLLIVAYVPPEKKDQLEGLLSIMDKAKNYNHIVVTGDLNAKSLFWNNRKQNACGALLEDYMNHNGIICMNDGQPTRRNCDSVIDLVLATPKVIPEVALCETMTHEAIRSDHIGILTEIYRKPNDHKVKEEKYLIRKTDWEIWRECSEEKFREWNESGRKYSDVDDMTASFMQVYTECMLQAVPKKECMVQNRRKKPPWWGDEVIRNKQALNKAKKSFRLRRTPAHYDELKECQEKFEEATERAKISWTEELCARISYAKSPKEMWDCFNKLTTYEEIDRGGVLPLVDENRNSVFDTEDKCVLLENVFFGGRHLHECTFDDTFKEDVEKEVLNIEEDHQRACKEDEEKCQEYLNYDISMSELEGAIQQLKCNKSPGKDEIYPELLKNGGKELKRAVLRIFQMSWETASVPIKWKVAEVKFLRKTGKSNYHDPSSYRPISLTSYLCKCLERIITYRLYGFVEHNKLLDKEQEGFRRFRGSTEAVLRLSQDIIDGFNSKKHTAALFIDVEKAYDSVWREGLMHKLWKMGINGRVWRWIKSFLTDRSVSISMGTKNRPETNSGFGLPQGSVISPLLFNLFIADWYKNVKCENVKFADDGTLWKTGNSLTEVLESLKADFGQVVQWAKRWRMKLNMIKTEFCVFSLDNMVLEEARMQRLLVNDIQLRYNPNPKLLGVALDEKLKFDAHIEMLERKGLRSLELLRKVKETEVVDSKCMLQLYKALVIPQLEYAVPVWQISNCVPLEKVQRKGLAMCLGVPNTAGIEALEVEAGVKPLDLRREELAIRQAGRIMAKDDQCCIKACWNTFVEEDRVERKVSPFGKMSVQVADMTSNTGLSLLNMEQEFNYQESLQPSRTPPEYWRNLGSSKMRSKEQENMAVEVVMESIVKNDTNTIVAFTDGSCLGNPGPCGAGACVFLPGNSEPVLLKRPVSSFGSILLGELIAIKIAIDCIRKRLMNKVVKIHIFSDSQSAIGRLTLGWVGKTHCATVNELKLDMEQLRSAGVEIEISWAPGHANIRGNEIADRLAKEAASEAQEIGGNELPAVTTLGDVKEAARKSGLIKWQERWEISESGRELFQFRPEVNFQEDYRYESARTESIITQLRTGYSSLNGYLKKVGVKEDDSCSCGEIETVQHFLLDCDQYTTEREKMRNNLFNKCGIMYMDLGILLQVKKDNEFKEAKQIILSELEAYLIATKRFVTRLP